MTTVTIDIDAPRSQDSGIYRLVFGSGRFYIGKSIHISERWKQHFDKFRKGKAAELMQREFDRWGFPECEILLVCHPDHIDIAECYLINAFAEIHGRESMLNTTYSESMDGEDFEKLMRKPELLEYSTLAHCMAIHFAEDKLTEYHLKCEELKSELKELRSKGYVIPEDLQKALVQAREHESILDRIKSEYIRLQKVEAEYRNYRRLPWWRKIFN